MLRREGTLTLFMPDRAPKRRPWHPEKVSKPRRAGGSRTFFDVLRHPVDTVIDPLATGDSQLQNDLTALGSGESREVSCFLRGEAAGLPLSFTQGTLTIDSTGMTWRRYWRHRRGVFPIPTLDRVVEIRRPGGHGERNIKRNLFKIVKATGPDGSVEFAVPGVGPELIRRAIGGVTGPMTLTE
jgi:hypothetical protein